MISASTTRKCIARRDEQARIAAARGMSAPPVARRTPARAPPWCPRQPRARRRRGSWATASTRYCGTRIALGMHHMLRDIVHAQRLEGAGAHMQRDAWRAARQRRRCRAMQRGIEMQAGGGRRHRAGLAREDALVALAVIGMQPRVQCTAAAARCHALRRRPAPRPGFRFPTGRRLAPVPRVRPRAASPPVVARRRSGRMGLLARICTRRGVAPDGAFEEHLDASAGGLGAEQARRHHARVVEDQQIVRLAAVPADRRNWRSARAPVAPSRVSSRLAERSGSGAWAISSGGSS